MRKMQIIGNVTKDAEVRDANGKKVINFSIAVNEKYKDRSGVKQEKTFFYNCVDWRERTTIAEYITKGTKVYVDGTPEIEKYQNKEGETVTNIKITVRDIELLGGGKKSEAQDQSMLNESFIPESNDGSDLPF